MHLIGNGLTCTATAIEIDQAPIFLEFERLDNRGPYVNEANWPSTDRLTLRTIRRLACGVV
jgi:hypothetical protein